HFSPDSKHLFFFNQTSDTANSFRLMKNGSPVTPVFEGMTFPFFSVDGSRWGLLGAKAQKSNEKFLIIDGKDAGYVGEAPQFTPDGKRVVSLGGVRPKQSVLLDGKPVITGIS